MTLRNCCLLASLIALASCGPQREPHQAVNNSAAPVLPAPSAPSAVENSPAPARHSETKNPLDPKSTEAAVQLVQRFTELMNQRKFDEAYQLFGPSPLSRSDFDREFGSYSNLNVKMLQTSPPDQEGAAGSIYVSIPIFIAGILNGKRADHAATVHVRRVNDVPGSTEAQRRWHIENIDETRM